MSGIPRARCSNHCLVTDETVDAARYLAFRGLDVNSASSATIAAAPWSPCVIPDQKEISEAKEKNLARGDNTADLPTKEYPRIKEQDTGEEYVAGPTSLSHFPSISRVKLVGVRKHVWKRVKRGGLLVSPLLVNFAKRPRKDFLTDKPHL